MIGSIVIGLVFALAIGVVLTFRARLATIPVRVGLAVIAVLFALTLLSGSAERIGFLIPVLAVVLLAPTRRTTTATT